MRLYARVSVHAAKPAPVLHQQTAGRSFCFVKLASCGLVSKLLCVSASLRCKGVCKFLPQRRRGSAEFPSRRKSLTFPFLQHSLNQITNPLCARAPCSRGNCSLTFCRQRRIGFRQCFVYQP